MRSYVAGMRDQAEKNYKRMTGPFESRDKWRRLLVSVALAHEKVRGGRCNCGAPQCPCVTRRQPAIENLGIAKQIERIEGLPQEDVDRFLDGDDAILHDMEI